MELYTKETWHREGICLPNVGQFVSDEVVEELAETGSPTTWGCGIFQPEEPFGTSTRTRKPVYLSFVRTGMGWMFVGLLPEF